MKIFANLGLNNGTDNIQNLIPESASEQNPLADKKYVDDNAYILPAASSDTLGGIKVGEGLTMTEDGVLSASGGGGNITYGTEDLTEGVSPLADGTIYFVYDDVANKIYSGYMGINGVAVKIYGDTSTVTVSVDKVAVSKNLIKARYCLAATTVGNYALFGGGYYDRISSSYVDAYSDTLVKSTETNLSDSRGDLAATTVGNYALFGGGRSASNTIDYFSCVDAYSATLVHSYPPNLGLARDKLAATTVGNYALFAGGYYYSSNSSKGVTVYVDAYSATLVHSYPPNLDVARDKIAATTVGNYAIFYSSSIDVYSDTLVKSTVAAPSVSRNNLAATTVGNYALFGGGSLNGQAVGTVDVFSENLVKFTASSLSTVRYSLAATTVGNYALFGGGSIEFYTTNNTRRYIFTAIVDVYSASLVKSVATDLSEIKDSLAATTVGNYALFGGGVNSAAVASVDAYTVTRTYF